MIRTPVSQDDLRQHLSEYLQELRNAAVSFDKGNDWEAKRCATVVAALAYNSAKSRGLLHQLDLHRRAYATSCAETSDWQAGEDIQVAQGILEDGCTPALDAAALSFTDLDTWWGMTVLRFGEHTFSRGEIVKIVRDQDGGAHVDGQLLSKYASVKGRAAATAKPLGQTGLFLVEEVLRNPARYVVRQVAHEMIKSLDPTYLRSPKRRPPDRVIVWGHAIARSGIERQDYRSTPGSALCPCRSGTLFALCHGRGLLK